MAESCPDLATIESDNLYNCVSMECLGLRISATVGCELDANPVQCLREADALDVLGALPQNVGFRNGVLWGRFLDDETMTTPPGQALFVGDFLRRPFMMGTTRDEATLFFRPGVPDVYTVAELQAYIGLWTDCADEIAPFYPAVDDESARDQYLRLLTDYSYTCPTNWAAQNVAFYQQDVWLYQFTHVPWAGTVDLDGRGFRLGAYHSAENAYVLGNIVTPATSGDCVADATGDFHCCNSLGECFEPPDVPLSADLMRLWADFARTGDPGAAWPSYDNTAHQHLSLESNLPVDADLRRATCDMWLGVSSHFLQDSGFCGSP